MFSEQPLLSTKMSLLEPIKPSLWVVELTRHRFVQFFHYFFCFSNDLSLWWVLGIIDKIHQFFFHKGKSSLSSPFFPCYLVGMVPSGYIFGMNIKLFGFLSDNFGQRKRGNSFLFFDFIYQPLLELRWILSVFSWHHCWLFLFFIFFMFILSFIYLPLNIFD